MPEVGRLFLDMVEFKDSDHSGTCAELGGKWRSLDVAQDHLTPILHAPYFSIGTGRVPWWLRGKSVCLQCRRPGFDSWVGKIPWRRKWPPTPVFLPGESHEWRSLVSYSPQGHKELDTTERIALHYIALPEGLERRFTL